MSIRYRAQGVLGGFLLLTVVGFLAFAGPPSHLDPIVVQLGLLGLAGLLMLLTAFANPLRERFGALQLTGFADVFLGISLPLSEVENAMSGEYGFFLVLLVGGLSLVAIGLDYLRGGEWFDVAEP